MYGAVDGSVKGLCICFPRRKNLKIENCNRQKYVCSQILLFTSINTARGQGIIRAVVVVVVVVVFMTFFGQSHFLEEN